MNYLVELGATLRQELDGDTIEIDGDIENNGILGHSGCNPSKVTVTGSISGTGTNHWEGVGEPVTTNFIRFAVYLFWGLEDFTRIKDREDMEVI